MAGGKGAKRQTSTESLSEDQPAVATIATITDMPSVISPVSVVNEDGERKHQQPPAQKMVSTPDAGAIISRREDPAAGSIMGDLASGSIRGDPASGSIRGGDPAAAFDVPDSQDASTPSRSAMSPSSRLLKGRHVSFALDITCRDDGDDALMPLKVITDPELKQPDALLEPCTMDYSGNEESSPSATLQRETSSPHEIPAPLASTLDEAAASAPSAADPPLPPGFELFFPRDNICVLEVPEKTALRFTPESLEEQYRLNKVDGMGHS